MIFLILLNNFCLSRNISWILYLTFINWHLGVFMVCILVMSNIGRKESDFKLDFWHFDLLPSLSKLWQILHLKMFRLGSREACVPISSLWPNPADWQLLSINRVICIWCKMKFKILKCSLNFLTQDIAHTHIQITWGMGNRWNC